MLGAWARFWKWWNEPERLPVVFPDGTELTEIAGFVPKDFRWGVQILNDDVTPMEFVVLTLEKELGLDRRAATENMLGIHLKGGMLIPTESFEIAKEAASRIALASSQKAYKLRVEAVNFMRPIADA